MCAFEGSAAAWFTARGRAGCIFDFGTREHIWTAAGNNGVFFLVFLLNYLLPLFHPCCLLSILLSLFLCHSCVIFVFNPLCSLQITLLFHSCGFCVRACLRGWHGYQFHCFLTPLQFSHTFPLSPFFQVVIRSRLDQSMEEAQELKVQLLFTRFFFNVIVFSSCFCWETWHLVCFAFVAKHTAINY